MYELALTRSLLALTTRLGEGNEVLAKLVHLKTRQKLPTQ